MNAQFVYAILVAGLSPYILTSIAKAGAFNPKENQRTRDWQAELVGWRKRADWAHKNSFEVFPLFAAAVVCCGIRAPHNHTAILLAWGFIATRVLFSACYIANWARLRTLCFFAGAGCVIGLFVIALQQ